MDFDFETSIEKGDSVALELRKLGYLVYCVKTVNSPLYITHHFTIDDKRQLIRMESASKVLEFIFKTKITVEISEFGDFAFVMQTKELCSNSWKPYKKEITNEFDFLLGKDINGNIVKSNLNEMSHLLIGGQTGAGKSVMLHTIIDTLTASHVKNKEDLRFIFIDTKRTEFAEYSKNKYNIYEVVNDKEKAVGVLLGLENILKNRLDCMVKNNLRQLDGCHLVVFIDELADLMQYRQHLVERSLVKIAQQGRCANMHLVLATQRPTVDVCTGHLKANIPNRIALKTISTRDSMNILDCKGAENLRGKGDSLALLPNHLNLVRFQGFTN